MKNNDIRHKGVFRCRASSNGVLMVSIHVDGVNKTTQISDWEIDWNDDYNTLELKCYFPSGKTYVRPLSKCNVTPIRDLGESLLRKKDSRIVKPIKKATIYGERYVVVHYPEYKKPDVCKLDSIEFVAQTTMKEEFVFLYFLAVANARRNHAGSEKQRKIEDNIVRQLKKLSASSDTVLHAYCTKQNRKRTLGADLIFPFGVNESQLSAVEQAFSSQVSVIEGPPGTGKTQTILNILANLLRRGQSVAVLSNNNAAVENVYEKLEKFGLDHLVAKLGNNDNKKIFFDKLPSWPLTEPETAPTMNKIQSILARLKQHLHDHNQAAQLQSEIDELTIEQRYLQQWQEDNEVQPSTTLTKYGLSPSKTADLMAYLSYLGEQRIRLKDRIELLFNFKIFRTKPFVQGVARLSIFYTLQMHYYDKALQDKRKALQICHQSLEDANFTTLLESLTTASMCYLKYHLHSQARILETFDEQTYKKQFDAFVQRFPILGSSTHSIVNSIADGAILDYVIIDEASQQDIVPGILALGCAKNLIIVGDNRQLAHIPVKLGLQAPADAYDCERYSLLDSCIKVFHDFLPRTLLKEHYRCHPRIIQFCNQQFYNNKLVPMTQDKGETPLRLVVTAKGNHTRQNTNLRELDSWLKQLEDEDKSIELDGNNCGFIAPFRAQVNLSGSYLPEDFVKDTVHKFQGRECDEIVFSTVLDKKRRNQEQKRLNFVDDPRMVNVAVSRAKHQFTIITGDDVFISNNGPIAALIRYIEYYAQDEQIVRAPVVSAFDLLYEEYDQSLTRLQAKLRPEDSRYKSEQIVAQRLREALNEPSCQALMCHSQVRLNQVASSTNPALTEQEQAFMRNRASCDFVLYFRVGKKTARSNRS